MPPPLTPSGDVVDAGLTREDIITLGNGAGDVVNANFSVRATITLGDGAGDWVNAANFLTPAFDTITLGNGAGDVVNADNSSHMLIILGDGDADVVNAVNGSFASVTLGDGAGDVVNASGSSNDIIALGNGNNDKVFGGDSNTITVGNGNDTIHVGFANTVTVGTGQDNFVFDQTAPGTIGAVTINGFDPSKDVIVMQHTLPTFSVQDDVHGNAVITFAGDNSDAITLMGVHASSLHSSDFQLV